MIAIHEERRSFWLRVKMLLTIGHVSIPSNPTTQPQSKPKRRSHRTTAFFEMP